MHQGIIYLYRFLMPRIITNTHTHTHTQNPDFLIMPQYKRLLVLTKKLKLFLLPFSMGMEKRISTIYQVLC